MVNNSFALLCCSDDSETDMTITNSEINNTIERKEEKQGVFIPPPIFKVTKEPIIPPSSLDSLSSPTKLSLFATGKATSLSIKKKQKAKPPDALVRANSTFAASSIISSSPSTTPVRSLSFSTSVTSSRDQQD